MEATNDRVQLDQDSLKEAVRKEMNRLGLSQTRLAKESGINQTRLSLWFSGKYSGDTEAVATALSRWLNAIQERDQEANRMSAAPDWRPTPTANGIIGALRYAHRAGDIALVYGGAGVGKTCTARHYQENHPNVWVATMSPAMNSVAACLERIALAIGLPEAQPSAVKTENAIVSRLENTGGLLIVDEAQHLPVCGLEAIRSVHDATCLGLALMGNESIYSRITGGGRQAHFAQLFSRVGYRVRLGNPSAGDVETLLAAWNIFEGKSQSLCMEIAKQSGALRGLTKVLRLGSLMLTEDDKCLTYDHIQTAWADLGGAL